jgi:diadenosine tetraphosphate (Ap4A) HIT family hydrolase
MPETAADYDARIREHLDADGRLPFPESGIPYWEIFPFEAEGLRLKVIDTAQVTEPDRFGEDPATCRCADPGTAGDGTVWENDRWRLTVGEPTGAPVVLVLLPKAHHDFPSLPADLAAEMGGLMSGIAAAVEALPSVARCHLSRWGDGGAHAHFFFIARPALHGQFRGTCMALWDDFLPPVPQDVFDANVAFVVERLTSTLGGGPVRG